MIIQKLLLSSNIEDLKIAESILDRNNVDELFEYHWILNLRYREVTKLYYGGDKHYHDLVSSIENIWGRMKPGTELYMFDTELYNIITRTIKW